MADANSEPKPGDLITVTVDDGNTVRAWHGSFAGTIALLTVERHDGKPAHVTPAPNAPEARTWLRLQSVTGQDFDPQGLTPVGQDWSFSFVSAQFAMGAPGITVTPLTADGETWMRAHESLDRKKDRLIAQFAQSDPDAAARLDAVIEALSDNAYERGRDAEIQSQY